MPMTANRRPAGAGWRPGRPAAPRPSVASVTSAERRADRGRRRPSRARRHAVAAGRGGASRRPGEHVGAGDPEQLPAAQRAATAPDRLDRVGRAGPPRRRSPSRSASRGAGHQLARPRRAAAAPPDRGRAGRPRTGTGASTRASRGPPAPRRAAAAGTTGCCRACRRPGGSRAGPGRVRARRRTRCSSTGSRVRWMAAVRRHPAGERLEVAQRAGRVGEAEDLQPVAGPPPGSAAARRPAPGPPPPAAAGRAAWRAAGVPRRRG